MSTKTSSSNARKAGRTQLLICAGTGCVSCKSFEVHDALVAEIMARGLEDEAQVIATGCQGFCAQGPIMIVQPEGIFYQNLTPKDVPHLIEEHLIKGRPIEKLMYVPAKGKPAIPTLSDIDFFSKQRLIVLRNRGLIDPEVIDEYIARDGYQALAKVLTSMTPEQVIDEVKRSGLRGRGGAGFPTGLKWEFTRKSEGDEKHVICNADEGDPGAFMDRSVIESDPFSVLEGMAIGAYAIGATHGYVYIREEYPLAMKRLKIAIAQARDYGLLGKDIFGCGLDFDVTVFRGAGAFVCGEETSLIASLEGRMPEPRMRPPFPAQSGVWGVPTNINNVETWANISPIINRGADWFASIGTEGSKGTKVFSVVGNVVNTGLVEVPMGSTLREIVFDIGGGIPKGRRFKAVQTGGPSGGCIPESLLDLTIDFERLAEVGSIMGSGGLIVMDEKTCMVDIARYFLDFLVDESCGKCTPCREGVSQMHRILERICAGEGRQGDIETLHELAEYVKDSSLCALGGTAPNPVLSTLKYFHDEYKAHIEDGKCPAGVCKPLIQYGIDGDKCKGCGRCIKACPKDAIAGERKEVHTLDRGNCIKCGACYETCTFDAVYTE
jgi:NADH:ubiquinone oxidoreductase subunit F (NADH-binding)/(2Fe-2S) ferredoxin/NAD-dependent dihydropyrimidine dehydrogenase PreA subunit